MGEIFYILMTSDRMTTAATTWRSSTENTDRRYKVAPACGLLTIMNFILKYNLPFKIRERTRSIIANGQRAIGISTAQYAYAVDDLTKA